MKWQDLLNRFKNHKKPLSEMTLDPLFLQGGVTAENLSFSTKIVKN